MKQSGRSLVLLFFLILLVIDLEVSELIRVFRRGDDSQPVPQVVLLQVLLRQVLEVPFTELNLGTDHDLRLVALDRDGGAQIVRLAIDFDPLVKILLLQNAWSTGQWIVVADKTQARPILTKSFAIIIPSSTGRLQSIVNFRDTFFLRGTIGFALLLLLVGFAFSGFGFRVTFFFAGAALPAAAAAAAGVAAFGVAAFGVAAFDFAGAGFESAVCSIQQLMSDSDPFNIL